MIIVENVEWHRNAGHDTLGAGTSLRRVLPQPGEQRTVWLPATECAPAIDQPLLWVPPFSEFNGWDSQPSEIPLSRIVTARLTRTARAAEWRRVECDAAILDSVPLLEACDTPLTDQRCDSLILANLRSPLFWDAVTWRGMATAGDLTFLDVRAGEAGLSMLFASLPDRLSVRYLQFAVADFRGAALGSWRVAPEVRQAIERQMQQAVLLRDQATPYLPADAS